MQVSTIFRRKFQDSEWEFSVSWNIHACSADLSLSGMGFPQLDDDLFKDSKEPRARVASNSTETAESFMEAIMGATEVFQGGLKRISLERLTEIARKKFGYRGSVDQLVNHFENDKRFKLVSYEERATGNKCWYLCKPQLNGHEPAMD